MKPSIKALLCQLTLSEMSMVTPHTFSNLEWKHVKREVARLRLRPSSKEFALVTARLFEATQPDSKLMQETVWILQVFIAAMKKKRVWFCYQLKDERDSVTISNGSDLVMNLIRAFKEHLLDIEVRSIVLDELIWSIILVKRQNKQSTRYAPSIFSVYKPSARVPHIFVNPMQVPYSEMIAAAFGYSSLKYSGLFGRDVAGMYDMLERKYSVSIHVHLPAYTPRDVLNSETSTRAYREAYAKQLLPGNTPIYQLTVQSKSKWKGQTYVPIDDEEEMEVTLKLGFNSSSSKYTVEDIIRHMITIGMITIPPPMYIQRLGSIAKNEVNLKSRHLSQSCCL